MLPETGMMHATRNDIPEGVRTQMIELLNARLADAIDLQLQTKQAHWNVKGPHFIALHKLFDSLVPIVSEIVDDVAERATALGGTALGTIEVVQEASQLPTYPTQIVSGPDHLNALTGSFAHFGELLRRGIDTATSAGDAVTADILTRSGGEIDKAVYFLESHLQSDT